jgi:hypothetical protein
MTISDYRRWYQVVFFIICPFSDAELAAYPYYLTNGENNEIKSPLTITSGLLSHGGLNHD